MTESTHSKRDGAMFCLRSLDHNKVYVDPSQVVFVEERHDGSRIVFNGGAELMVSNDQLGAHEVIRAWKQGEQD